ncbi:MAG: branched-chain amino acid ABC transporter permease [Gaiellaceae bacterium]
MATAESASADLVPRRLPVAQILLWIFGTAILAVVGIWLIRNAVDSPDRFLEVTLIGVTNGSVYALIALGYTLVYGIIELINFAHGDNFMLGTFQANSIVTEGSFQIPLFPTTFVLGLPLGTMAVASDSGAHRAYTVAMCLFWSMLFCMTINVAIERMAYKPLRNQPRLVPLITAIGFSFILQDVGLVWKDAGPQPLPSILPKEDIFTWRSASYSWNDLIVVGVTLPLLLALTYLVRRTRSGKAMRATAQDMDAAAMMGINVDRTISFTFALGGALAGAAGAIYALYIGTSKFDLGFRLGLFAFTAAVLGGIGNLTGAVLGGLVLGLIQAYNEGFADARWTTTIIFGVLILILVFRPSGLLGEQVPEGQ